MINIQTTIAHLLDICLIRVFADAQNLDVSPATSVDDEPSTHFVVGGIVDHL